MKRVKGHALRSEGQSYAVIHDWQGRSGVRYTGTFTGFALCECGAQSDLLPSDAERKRWHREHKQAMLDAAANA